MNGCRQFLRSPPTNKSPLSASEKPRVLRRIILRLKLKRRVKGLQSATKDKSGGCAPPLSLSYGLFPLFVEFVNQLHKHKGQDVYILRSCVCVVLYELVKGVGCGSDLQEQVFAFSVNHGFFLLICICPPSGSKHSIAKRNALV